MCMKLNMFFLVLWTIAQFGLKYLKKWNVISFNFHLTTLRSLICKVWYTMMLVCTEVNNVKCKHFYCCYHLILIAVTVPKTRKNATSLLKSIDWNEVKFLTHLMVISVLKNIYVLSHSYNVHLGESKCQVHRVYEFISGKPFPPWKLI